MTKLAVQDSGQPATDLLEESVRLLRRAPVSVLLTHFVGSVPGMLATLYFLADLSSSADAEARVLPASVGMTVAYLWMKCWQSVFAARLRAELLLQDPPQWTVARVLNLVVGQLAIQPTGMILRPLALVLTLPHVWTTNFYQNVTVLGDGDHGTVRDLWRSAYRQCRLWPKQAHIAATLLAVFGFFVWLNVFVAMFCVPLILKMFLGVETMFSKHLGGLLSPTFFVASFAATYVCLDPIRKTVTVLRCFYGSSLKSGADLMVQLRTVRRSASRGAAVVAAVLLCFAAIGPVPAGAAMHEESKVKTSELNRSLDEVLERREYAWRAPRERKDLSANSDGWLARFIRDVKAWGDRLSRKAVYWLRDILRKILDWFSGSKKTDGPSASWWDSLGSVRVLFYSLLGVVAVLLIVLVSRYRRRPRIDPAQAESAVQRPDLRDEGVTADQLPEDGWLQLARELMQSGELRLAMRASYLAGLAHLGERELIRLAKHKSDRDYAQELRRRARTQPELLAAFAHNLTSFERSWYGEHDVTEAILGDFSARLETIRAC